MYKKSKFIFTLPALVFFGVHVFAEEAPPPTTPTSSPSLPKALWNLCDSCAQPESAYYDAETQNIFISNVDGDAVTKDSKGSIQKVDLNGKMKNAIWITGLNSPKGIRSSGGKLFVADIDELVVIHGGKIEKKVKFPGAKLLNDVAIDSRGVVYVSDTLGSQIFKWDRKSKPKVLVSGKYLESPNGLLLEGNTLWIAAWGVANPDWSTPVPGRLLKLDLKTEEVSAVNEKPVGNLDGIEVYDNEHFIVSDWVAGKVYLMSKKGESKEILSGFKGAADIGYISKTQTLIVPRMGDNLITAFDLKTVITK